MKMAVPVGMGAGAIERLTRVLTSLSLGVTLMAAGCASPPRLDDAQVGTLSLQTSEDAGRRAQAQELYLRLIFGGASVIDPQMGFISFGQGSYDRYRDYIRSHPKAGDLAMMREKGGFDLPVLRITFFTQRLLAGPIDPTTAYTVEDARVTLYFCGTTNPLRDFIANARVMWRGTFVTNQLTSTIQRNLQETQRPQEYEVFFPYTYWDRHSERVGRKTVTLLPPSGDLCLSMVTTGWPLPSTVGPPLVISRAAVAAVLRPLPREVTDSH